ncbi:hypothetical protein F5Y00DRAFT_88484 [Daldinia vernicosa]|uniref:uncharacterized protein n=1 Tax=Daldinia vernicosa TaxID=114800 RepID=UPI0020080AF9|nr:uncharacterized protein F5Y00DRAFT_88484 [Daldinia vernicosa]KAI0848264.1 hypothetical protein F5Y00DRAFT_88484 [Daldinia vernicosa]
MCTGTQTEMACGHVLTHYDQYCDEGRRKPCPQPELSAPRAYLDDSCAECDPMYMSNLVRREHRDRRTELMDQIYAHKRAGHMEEVRRLLERMEVVQRAANIAMGEMRYLCSSSVDVEFPGGGPDAIMPRGTSRWVDGKCVWEEDVPYSVPGSQRNKRAAPKQTHVEEQELPRISGSPRLRSTKKEYVDPFKEESDFQLQQEQQPKVSRPPRLRTNKEYTGPRGDSVVVFDGEEDTRQAPSLQPRLRRSKTYINKLDHIRPTSQGSEELLDSDKTVRPIVRSSRTKYVAPGVDEEEEDIWLQLAEKCVVK